MQLSAIFSALARRVEAVTLVVILIIAGALWVFAKISGEVMNGDLRAFDNEILFALRTPDDLEIPIGGQFISMAMRDLTALGGVPVLMIVSAAVLAYLILRAQHATAAFLAIAILGGQVLAHFAKIGFSRTRPDLVPHAVEVTSASFPSGHSMMAAVTYLTLAVILCQIETQFRMRAFYISLAALLAFLVGISRLFLGVHWPTDVLAGWVLGAAWALGVWLVVRTSLISTRSRLQSRNSRR